MATEFELSGHKYQIKNMNCLDGTRVLAKIAPMIVPLMRIQMAGAGGEGEEKVSPLNVLFDNVEQMTGFLAKMPDSDLGMVMAMCLRCVSRSAGGGKGWQEVWNEGAGAVQFADIRPLDALTMVGNVIKDQIIPFSSGSLLQ